MKKISVTTPFFVVNPKSYLCGPALLELAETADQLAAAYPGTIFFTVPFADLEYIARNTRHIVVTAQHMDGIVPGRGIGHILPESVYRAGARATFLNHAERPLLFSELVSAIERADELGILTIVCAGSLKEARAIAKLDPDILLCEPSELIGTGKTSDVSYIEQTNQAIRSENADILVMQAAGISTAEDVYRTIALGADGTGCTSGIVCADNPGQALRSMVEALDRAGKGACA